MTDSPIYFVADDVHGKPTLWFHDHDPDPDYPNDQLPVLRRSDLGAARDHWDELVRRVVEFPLTAVQMWALDKAARR